MKRLVAAVLWALLLGGCIRQQEIACLQQSAAETTQADREVSAAFHPASLVDTAVCGITVVGVEGADPDGYTLVVEVENRTQGVLLFYLEDAAVNGYMCEPYWAASLEPGTESRERITFRGETLQANGIAEVAEISGMLMVFSGEHWNDPLLMETPLRYYPQGPAAAVEDPRKLQPGETLLLDNALCTLVVTGFTPEAPWGYGVEIFIENKTGQSLIFTCRRAQVNGVLCDPGWAEPVAPGKRCNSQILWLGGNLENCGITQVESITLPLLVYDSRGKTEELLLEQTFVIEP